MRRNIQFESTINDQLRNRAVGDGSLPPMVVYINAIYLPNFRISSTLTQNLPLDCISHIFYAFASVQPNGTVHLSNLAVDTELLVDGSKGALRACRKLKEQRPYLKIILSIGGGAANKAHFASAASDKDKRATFAYTARRLVDEYDLDGVDVDWECPEPGQESEDFVQLFSVLRAYFPRPQYIITTALPAATWCLQRFQLHRLASRVDFLNLMGYDFVGNWGQPIVSGHHALFAPYGGSSSAPAIQYLVSGGFPADKIILGCPAYGWSFLDCDNINQQTNMCGNPPLGTFDFGDLPRQGTQEFVDETSVAAFCVGGDGGFVSYDNTRTIQMKANWIKSMRLAGLFYWHALSDAPGTRSLVYNGYMALHS